MGPNFRFIPRSGSTKLVIYFSGTGKSDGKFDFWGVGRDIRENLLFVNDGRNHWYQDGIPGLGATVDESAATIQRWCDHLGVKEVIAIGASMGGYGAILYACKLGGRAFSFGNDIVLRLPMSRSEQLMPKSAKENYSDIAPLIEATSTQVDIIAGEMDPMDMVGAKHIAHLPSVNVISLRGVTHWCARYLNEAVGLVELLTTYVKRRKLPKLDEEGNYLLSTEFVQLMYDANRAMKAVQGEECLALCERALEIHPLNEAALYLKGFALMKLGRNQEALAPLAIVVAAVPLFEDAQVHFAMLMRLLGDYPKAIHTSKRILEKWPTSDKTHYNLARAYQAIGNNSLAYSHAAEAAKLQPNRSNYENLRKKLSSMRSK